MLNCGFACNPGAVLWANAPMPEHNSNAQRLISAYRQKPPLFWFLGTNKRYILPPSRLESLRRHVTREKTPRAWRCRRQHALFRWLRFGRGSLAFYRHLKRLAQHVVVGNCVLSDEYQQVTPGGVLRGDLAHRRCVPHQINRARHFHGYVIGDGGRRVLSRSRMRLHLSNGGYLPLGLRLAKSRKCKQTQTDYSY